MNIENTTKNNTVLSFIERTLFWEGEVSAKYLADAFSLDIKSAKIYIADYSKNHPGNIYHDTSDISKLYPNDDVFRFVYAENKPNNILQFAALKNAPYFEELPKLQPLFDKDILKDVIRALNKRDKVLTIRYQSLNSSIPQERDIIPYSIYFVRGRYHVRAYCLNRNDFRDFLLSRIISIVSAMTWDNEPVRDRESSETVTVRIKPHEQLSAMQKMCTEMEFGMIDGIKEIKVKKSLLIYLLDELRVGKDYYKPPFTVLELANKDEIMALL